MWRLICAKRLANTAADRMANTAVKLEREEEIIRHYEETSKSQGPQWVIYWFI